MEAALAQRDAIIPALIEVLHDVSRNPDTTAYQVAHVYAAYLLGHFRAAEAHAALLEIGRMDDDAQWRHYGDFITEDYATILLATCAGD